MDVGNGLGVLLAGLVVPVHLGFTRYRSGVLQRETARAVQEVLVEERLTAAEQGLLLRFFCGCTRWWWLPATLAAAIVLVPRLCFFAPDRRQERLSSETLDLLLRCLRFHLARYPLTALVVGSLLLLWLALLGVLSALLPRSRALDVQDLVRTLSCSLTLLRE